MKILVNGSPLKSIALLESVQTENNSSKNLIIFIIINRWQQNKFNSNWNFWSKIFLGFQFGAAYNIYQQKKELTGQLQTTAKLNN